MGDACRGARRDGDRGRLGTRILDLGSWEGGAVLAATHIRHMLGWPNRLGHHDLVPELVERGNRALDELNARSVAPQPRQITESDPRAMG